MSWVALSHNGGVLAAVADDVYVFIRDGKAFNPLPQRLGIGGLANRYVTGVAVHPDGTWLVACDQAGHVYMATIDNGTLSRPVMWTAPGGVEIPFLSVAIAGGDQGRGAFVAGGGNSVVLISREGMNTGEGPIDYDTTTCGDPKMVPPDKSPGRPQENVRWVAISADGNLITAVANRQIVDPSTEKFVRSTGVLVAFSPGQTEPLWMHMLENSPNSTSVDGKGTYVTASDGYPTGTPAKFYLFDARVGKKLWDFTTCNMNWPMVISADASAIAAGSDDGSVYYFRP